MKINLAEFLDYKIVKIKRLPDWYSDGWSRIVWKELEKVGLLEINVDEEYLKEHKEDFEYYDSEASEGETLIRYFNRAIPKTQIQSPGWYFYDEVGLPCGPYVSEEDAIKTFKDYCEWLKGE